MRGAGGTQVIRRFQTAQPRQFVGLVELFARRAGHVNVERLGLVNPLLAARGGFDQPGGFDFKRGGVQRLDVLWHTVDRAQ